MFASLPFDTLTSRDDLARAADRFLKPLLPMFLPHGAGICLGVEFGVQGERTASLETFSRALWGLVPLLAGGGSFAESARWRAGIVAGTDPAHPGYWGLPGSCDQRQVEQPAIALAVALAPQVFWDPLSAQERAGLAAWLGHTNSVDIVDSNWRWFRVLVNACLRVRGEKWSPETLASDLQRIDEFYLGDGWYRDENRVGDYYIPMAMHFYGLIYAKLASDFDPERASKYRERARVFAQDFVHWFAADGAAIPFGRSLIYRTAQGAFWGALAFADVEVLPWGEIKGLLLRHLRWWLAQPIFSETGLLSVGYRYPNPAIGESYNAYGSPYWALKAFLPLALPASHPFWQAEEQPMRARAALSVQPGAHMTLHHHKESGHVFALNQGQTLEQWPRHCAHKYGKCVYSAVFGFGVAAGGGGREAAGLDCTFALSDDGGKCFRVREKSTDFTLEQAVTGSTWAPWPDVEVRTWLAPALPGHLRVHRIRSARPLVSADGGFAVDSHGPGYGALAEGDAAAANANALMGSAVIDLTGGRRGSVQRHEPWFHLMWFCAGFPVLFGDLPAGETWLATYATGWPGRWGAEELASESAGWEASVDAVAVRVRRAGVEIFAVAREDGPKGELAI